MKKLVSVVVTVGVVAAVLSLNASGAAAQMQGGHSNGIITPSDPTIYACVKLDKDKDESNKIRIVAANEACKKNEVRLDWNAQLPSYGVGTVSVKRGALNAPAVWSAYSTRLGSPLGADLLSSQAAVLGDTAGGAFRFTCRDTHGVCEVSVAAAALSTTAGETVYVYPRVLVQKQSYSAGGPQSYCEYGDGSAGAIPTAVLTQTSTSTPTYTPMMINIGGSADCSGPVSTAGDVNVITVGPGYYDVFTTFVFKKPPM